MKKKVGVLALQGDFEAHQKALERAGADAVQVRTPSELARVQGLGDSWRREQHDAQAAR